MAQVLISMSVHHQTVFKSEGLSIYVEAEV
jgi:hypothetical protein